MDIRILGVNDPGRALFNPLITGGRELPWLQDDDDNDVWNLWNVTYRDVIILDANNEVHAVYNLTFNDLGIQENREAVMQLMLEAAAIPADNGDLDGDGLPDVWEQSNFNSLDQSPGADPDQDGVNNGGEFVAGTNPNESNSVLRVHPAFNTDLGRMELTWPSVENRFYRVMHKNSIDAGNWVELGAIPGKSGSTTFSHSADVNESAGFFRVLVELSAP